MTFETLGLSQPILHALEHKKYTTPTPIQTQAIPIVLEGSDLFGIAQTGTGKTAAFMLPSIDRLTASGQGAPKRSCRMLVLAPTRELATQIAESARDYGAFSGLSVASVMGGTPVGKDRHKLAGGVDILVATPGRLVDLIDQKAFSLQAVEILVLDEADQMLDLGFIHALRKIVSLVPAKRQTLLFSATMPKTIKQLAAQYLNRPQTVSVTPAATTAERVDQYVCFVNQAEKPTLLTLHLRKGFQSGEMDRVLVFTRTKHGADRVARRLGQSGIAANVIHGNRSQAQRERALDEFRNGKARVLIATDIAARGIDIRGVSHVFNFELPNVAEQYVHRIGRTARAGAAGVAIAFCAPDEKDYLRDIERLTGVTLDRVPLPEAFRSEVEKAEAQRPPEPRRLNAPAHARTGHGDRNAKRGGGGRPQRSEKTRSAGPRTDGQRGDAQRHEGQRSGAPRRARGNGQGQRSGR